MANSYSISHSVYAPNLPFSASEPSKTSPPALSAVEWKILDTAGAKPEGISFVTLQQLMPEIGQDALRNAVSDCLKGNLLSGDFRRFSCTDQGLTALVDNAYEQLMPSEPDTSNP